MNASYRSLNSRRRTARFATCIMFSAAVAIALPAQTFTTLDTFDNTDGRQPYAGLVQAANGNLYGTTSYGSANGNNYTGTIFEITPAGALTTLYTFCSQANCADGQAPRAGLIQGANGNFYGTTASGGVNAPCDGAIGCGTVFQITPAGTLTTLYTFCPTSPCTDGATPVAGLVQAANGDFYGTTQFGGAYGYGTVFKITPSGKLTTLYTLCSLYLCADGANPVAGLVQGANGDFYGTTEYGGAHSAGTVFKITPSGKLTTLYSFCSLYPCLDGSGPEGLIQAASGDFYGTTSAGGPTGACDVGQGCGTVFKITPTGTLKTIHSFCSESGCPDGRNPAAGLIQATDGNLYGTTAYGGNCGSDCGDGTVFRITPSGKLTTLYSFDGPSGSNPSAVLVQDTNGTLYGTTPSGGANYDGTVFSLSVGLGPFVKTLPTSGKVGAAIKILGTDLTTAASVTFNGTAAAFTVLSASEIAATVPAGSTTGTVQVATTGGTLSSNLPFRVTP